MKQRSIIIGDVHGMIEPLKELVMQLNLSQSDSLIFIGDVVDKGPSCAEVVSFIRQLKDKNHCNVILVEGNHEDKHKRYKNNLTLRPEIAAEQALAAPELAALDHALSPEDRGFLSMSVPFYRIDALNLLMVHGGIPGDMMSFPSDYEALETLSNKQRKSFDKIMRTRFIKRETGTFLAMRKNEADDPFWATDYDGRFGHVVFGHQPFMGQPAEFGHATGIDTGAVHGGGLTALIFEGKKRSYLTVPSEAYVPFIRQDIIKIK